eukprot:gnl/TRDRNA2_/TRDRNA2_125743_c0_seq1.p1 gnl/TRDRNA2_/TRDRNA2_125743_c0~~gnl/TRDRNA2_/TRDRNA2_125743_c0_seq1.p1  ORF type:complete len:459 (-),score=64.43 gnl/TRDRNA2_/TRDRNA2_125743_c0_seq1:142-1518(-)
MRLQILLSAASAGLAFAAEDIRSIFKTPDWWKIRDNSFPEKDPLLEDSQKPNPGRFPGKTVEDSNDAFPSGKQPENLEAWPRDPTTGRPGACWDVRELEDTADGWHGNCQGLTEATHLKTEVACKAACINEPMCPVWQFGSNGCWLGSGYDCERVMTGEHYVHGSSQRLIHGAVNVLLDLKKPGDGVEPVQITKLTSQPVNTISKYEIKADAANPGGVDKATGSHTQDDPVAKFPSLAEATIRCKYECYSDIRCEYWMFGKDGSCWIDRAGDVEYPLTTQGDATRGDAYAKDDMVAGEYVQHYCPPKPTPAPVGEKKPREGPKVLYIVLGILAALLVIVPLAWILSVRYCKPKKGAVRALRPKPPPAMPEPPAPQQPLVQPSPVIMTVQPTPVQVVRTVAAPVQYAAVPQQYSYAAPSRATSYAAQAMYAAPSYAAPGYMDYAAQGYTAAPMRGEWTL